MRGRRLPEKTTSLLKMVQLQKIYFCKPDDLRARHCSSRPVRLPVEVYCPVLVLCVHGEPGVGGLGHVAELGPAPVLIQPERLGVAHGVELAAADVHLHAGGDVQVVPATE